MRGSELPVRPLIPEELAPPEAPPTALQARWSNWWGSPQLFAHLVACLANESGVAGSVLISFHGHGHEERFDSVDAFLERVSPEMLRRFTSAECHVRGPVCEVDLVMARRQVTVEVRALDPHDARIALARIVDEANRGYRPFWGPASWPADVAPRTRYQRYGRRLRDLIDVAVGALFGIASFVVAARLSGAEAPPGWLILLILISGAGIVTAINRAVPAVEIATHGRTRLRVIATRLGATGGAWIAAQALGFLAGG